MLTDQERQALDASVDTAIETANRMKSIITNVSAKRNVVEKIIIAQKSVEESSASNQISDFINLTSKIDEFIENVSMVEASNPVPTPLLGHRCRSSQEITGSPTPFSTSNHYLWICASASFSLSNPNIAA
jgi:hypothetical protein